MSARAPSSSGSGLPATVQTKTANYTAAAGEYVKANAASGGFTVTLPSGPTTGALVAVKKIDATSATVTIAPSGAGSIDGQANATTTTQWAGAVFEHLGSDAWHVVASMTTTGPQGATGPTGATGATGPTGPQGTPSGGLLPRVMVAGRYYTPPGVLSTRNLDSGYEFAFPFEVFASTTFTKIGISINTLAGSASVRLGVRADASGLPGTLQAQGATAIDASTGTGVLGDNEVNFAQTLPAGVYWLVARSEGGTPNVDASNNLPVLIGSTSSAGAMQNNCSGYDNGGGGSGVLPNSWGSTYAHTVTVPRVVLKTA